MVSLRRALGAILSVAEPPHSLRLCPVTPRCEGDRCGRGVRERGARGTAVYNGKLRNGEHRVVLVRLKPYSHKVEEMGGK